MNGNIGYQGLLVACGLAGMNEKETRVVLESAGFSLESGDMKRSRRKAETWTRALFERSITPNEFEEEMHEAMSAGSKKLSSLRGS